MYGGLLKCFVLLCFLFFFSKKTWKNILLFLVVVFFDDLKEIKNSSQARQEPDLNEKPVSRFFVPPKEKKLSQKTF